MKSNELRIGNYIYDQENNLLEISGYIINRMSVLENRNEDTSIDYKDIQLTEEWLLKFGFDKYIFEVDNENQKTSDTLFRINVDKFDTIIISISKMFSFPMLKNKDGQHYYLRGITSVHQLQNLYFALTGEELTIDL